MNERKKIFISYSWDGQEHQDWVLKLAKDLISKYGIEVILDQFDLNAGNEMTFFMENAIAEADKVLVILTPNYKLKAEKREKGVGYETSIISQEILSSKISKIKFIPVLRIGNQNTSSPIHLASKLYHNMTDDNKYYDHLFELAKIIYDKTIVAKPKLGEIPNFEDPVINDPIIDFANEFMLQDELNEKLDRIISSYQGAELSLDEKRKIESLINEKEKLYSENTKLLIKTKADRDSILINCMGFSAVINFDFATNTAKFTTIIVRYFKGYLNFNSSMYFPGEEPKLLATSEYKFDLDGDENVLWKSKSQSVNSEKLVNEVFSTVINNLKKGEVQKI
jgi:hypothetical protein